MLKYMGILRTRNNRVKIKEKPMEKRLRDKIMKRNRNNRKRN